MEFLAPYFANPALALGAGLVAVPIIIHLLNRLRFRRVRWAAMNFLLESQKRNRRRVLLEQLLLLLLRCLAVLLVAMLVARPLLDENLASMLGGGARTDHVLVLDDSYSMGQREGQTTAYEDARAAVLKLVNRLAEQPGAHTLTLLRTSKPGAPDMLAVRLTPAVAAEVGNRLPESPSFLPNPPEAAVTEAAGVLRESDASRKVLHLFSDFRKRDWPEDSELASALRKLSESDIRIHLVASAEVERPNLGVGQITAQWGSVAASVPFPVEATILNHSNQELQNVAVTPLVDGRPQTAETIAKLPAKGQATVRFNAVLPEAGLHTLTVKVPDDVLAADNLRWMAVDLRERVPVLLVDGVNTQPDAVYVSHALSPGGSVRTGLEAEIRDVARLEAGNLDEYRGILLMNVATLTPSAAANLREYVAGGGGLAWFLGDQVQPDLFNRLLVAGDDPLFPVPLGPAVDGLPPDELPESPGAALATEKPDLLFEPHPIFRIFEGERNPFLATVRFSRYFTLDAAWKEDDHKNVTVMARYRDGRPLVLESTLGNGRIVAFLTTAGPAWNSWARNPSYVVALLELQRYLAEPVGGEVRYRVGEPWNLTYEAAAYRRGVLFTAPQPGDDMTQPTTQDITLDGELAGLQYNLAFGETGVPGPYRMTMTRGNGEVIRRVRAYNVDPAEGSLEIADSATLAQRLPGVRYVYSKAADFEGEREESRADVRDWLLLILVILLVGEGLLAFRMSYHPPVAKA